MQQWSNRLGKRKRMELIVASRADGIADCDRVCASQTIMLRQGIKDPLRSGVNMLSHNMFSTDRVGIILHPGNNSYRIVPKNYKDIPGMKKASGKQDLGFMSKHDLTIGSGGDLVALHSILKDERMPADETIKLRLQGYGNHQTFIGYVWIQNKSSTTEEFVEASFEQIHIPGINAQLQPGAEAEFKLWSMDGDIPQSKVLSSSQKIRSVLQNSKILTLKTHRGMSLLFAPSDTWKKGHRSMKKAVKHGTYKDCVDHRVLTQAQEQYAEEVKRIKLSHPNCKMPKKLIGRAETMITMLQPVFRNTIEQQGIQAGFAEAGLVVTGKRLEVNEAQIWRGFPGMHQKTPAQMRDYTIALAALEEEVEDYRLARCRKRRWLMKAWKRLARTRNARKIPVEYKKRSFLFTGIGRCCCLALTRNNGKKNKTSRTPSAKITKKTKVRPKRQRRRANKN